ncbi:hypothetical protein NHG23_08545 [Aerococcaceae bacterium NML190073]|nr:hypothetical protein [Aerococcaceae bacterium NML190073]
MRIFLSVTQDYVIDKDKYQYILVRRSLADDKDGNPKYDENGEREIREMVEGYYPQLDVCLKALAIRLTDDSIEEPVELKEYIKRVKNIYGMIQAEMIF